MQRPCQTRPFFAHAEFDAGDGQRLTLRCEGTQVCTLWSDDVSGHKLTKHRLTLPSLTAALDFFDRCCDAAEALGMPEHPFEAMRRSKVPTPNL